MDDQERLARSTDLLQLLLEQYETYHDHKENMGHAGFLVQIGALAAVVTTNEMPPAWMQAFDRPEVMVSLAVIAAWLLTNTFIRWQLKNRRFAALLFAAILSTLRDWAVEKPPSAELLPATTPKRKKGSISPKTTARTRVLQMLDYLLPVPSADLHSDVPLEKYSAGLNQRLIAQRKAGTGAVKSEWLLFIIGFALLLLALWRIWV